MLQDRETALHKAAFWGDVEVVKMLVKYEATVDVRNKVAAALLYIQSSGKKTLYSLWWCIQ